MIFVFLCIFFFILGFFHKKSLLLFFFLLVTLPISNSFAIYFYKNGLLVYDFYIFSFLISHLILSINKKKKIGIPKFIFIPMIFLIVYALSALIIKDVSIYVLKDFRIIIFLIYCYFFLLLQESKIKLSEGSIYFLILISSIFCCFYWIIISIGLIGFSDFYYQDNIYRFASIGTYLSSFFIILSSIININSNLRFQKILVLICFMAVFLSGFRLLFFITFLIFLIPKASKNFSATFFSLALAIFVMNNIDSNLINLRVLDLSFENIAIDIVNRFAPFFEVMRSFSAYNFFFGGGFGQTFYIPWFEYRHNIDVVSNTIDSTFFTLYAKLGVFSLYYIASIYFIFVSLLHSTKIKQKITLVLYLTALFFVYSVPFQITSIGLLLGVFILGQIEQVKN